MKRFAALSMGLCFLFAGLNTVAAQDKSGVMSPPKVLLIQREFIKPGKSGSLHLKTESAFVKAFEDAKWPTHYLAMDSLSGASRSLFMVGYDSYAAWEQDNQAMQKNATLSAAVDQATVADGELLSGYDAGIFNYRDDLSLRPDGDISHMRYFEILRMQARPGHEKEFEDMVKMYVKGYEKAAADAHWVAYQSMYGNENGGVYIFITPMKSGAEIDSEIADSKPFAASVGESGLKKLAEMAAASVEASATNLFMFNPKMSYPSDSWIKADPTFWKPAQ